MSMQKLTVIDPVSGFTERETHSKAILNTDKKALDEYLIKKEIAKKSTEKTELMNLRIANLEKDVKDIKDILLDIKIGLQNVN